MIPKDFDGVNTVLVRPENWAEKDCQELPVFSAYDQELKTKVYVSCWQFSDAEWEEIVKNKEVWITDVGSSHPPIAIEGISPFKKDIGIIS